MSKPEALVAFHGEAQFAGWNDSNTAGCKITFWLPDPSEAAGFIYRTCLISSRRMLDHDAAAAQRYENFVRVPFISWLQGLG